MHLVGCTIRIYYGARACECQALSMFRNGSLNAVSHDRSLVTPIPDNILSAIVVGLGRVIMKARPVINCM